MSLQLAILVVINFTPVAAITCGGRECPEAVSNCVGAIIKTAEGQDIGLEQCDTPGVCAMFGNPDCCTSATLFNGSIFQCNSITTGLLDAVDPVCAETCVPELDPTANSEAQCPSFFEFGCCDANNTDNNGLCCTMYDMSMGGIVGGVSQKCSPTATHCIRTRSETGVSQKCSEGPNAGQDSCSSFGNPTCCTLTDDEGKKTVLKCLKEDDDSKPTSAEFDSTECAEACVWDPTAFVNNFVKEPQCASFEFGCCDASNTDNNGLCCTQWVGGVDEQSAIITVGGLSQQCSPTATHCIRTRSETGVFTGCSEGPKLGDGPPDFCTSFGVDTPSCCTLTDEEGKKIVLKCLKEDDDSKPTNAEFDSIECEKPCPQTELFNSTASSGTIRCLPWASVLTMGIVYLWKFA